MAMVIPSRVPHVTIEIRDVAHRELMTAIEILSPTNKCGEGYREYLDKRRRLLCSMAHLIGSICSVEDAFNYDLSLDYTRPAEIPLVGEALAWAAERLHQAGIVKRIE
jgi:hypothetical protein